MYLVFPCANWHGASISKNKALSSLILTRPTLSRRWGVADL